MKISHYILLAIITSFVSQCTQPSSEERDKQEILNVMKLQERAWSNNNIDEFMEGYWKSDSLKFFGSNGLTYGWNATLQNYKKKYPTAEHTGKLHFTIVSLSKITEVSYMVMGRYKLKRSMGDAAGVFTVIFKKISGKWKIIADISC